jgi:creatinine amidohydrolase
VGTHERKVQYEWMLPHELESALEQCPTAFVPLGTLEWHGVQNALGLDAIKAHALCVRAARQGGGVVLPPLFGGVGGVDEPYTVVMDVEPTFTSALLEPWLMRLCEELKRVGFRAAIMLTGHYGASQQMIVREVAVRQTQRLDIPILGTPEYFLAMDAGYTGDHGGAFETSLMMELYPQLVDLEQLQGEPPYKGIGGGDAKRDSSRELGARFCEVMVERLARLAGRMPTWDEATRRRFLRAEQALVSHQLETGGRAADVWAAWWNLAPMLDYGRLVAEERFEDIETLANADER